MPAPDAALNGPPVLRTAAAMILFATIGAASRAQEAAKVCQDANLPPASVRHGTERTCRIEFAPHDLCAAPTAEIIKDFSLLDPGR